MDFVIIEIFNFLEFAYIKKRRCWVFYFLFRLFVSERNRSTRQTNTIVTESFDGKVVRRQRRQTSAHRKEGGLHGAVSCNVAPRIVQCRPFEVLKSSLGGSKLCVNATRGLNDGRASKITHIINSRALGGICLASGDMNCLTW